MVRKLIVCASGGMILLCAVIMLNLSKIKSNYIANRYVQSFVDQYMYTGYPIVNVPYPTIYFITPTHNRPTQKADLTRLAQTLHSIKGLIWILVEDSTNETLIVNEILAKYNIRSVHLYIKTAKDAVHKGLAQRNAALDWIRSHHVVGNDKAVVYFGDDDNSYDWLLFNELRKTKQVGVLPVGLSGGKQPGEQPIVENGKVVSFFGWNSKFRKFAVDMAGFVFNADLLFKYPNLKFIKNRPGFLETDFLEQFVKIQDLEPLAENCTRFYVWHVRTTH